jgi:SAM-dependent methyltransferase
VSAADHWTEVARQWDQVGPPLRPSAEDLAAYRAAIDRWTRDRGAPRALILGVTPELARLPWPAGTHLLAIDHTPSMIRAVWPGPLQTVVCGDWTAMPLRDAARDLVLLDGGLHLLTHPDGQQRLVQALRRVVAPGGLCVLRLFVPSRHRETPEAVLRALLAGVVANLNLLKLRLSMALQRDKRQGVSLGAVWLALHAVAPDLPRLADRLGWPLDHLLTINTYRDSAQRYHYVSVADVRWLFCRDPGGFQVEAIQMPTYDLGDRCPIVVFRRSGR